jgi:hypothetical protein
MNFYEINVSPRQLIGVDYRTASDMIKQILEAMKTALANGGVVEYHVGSRGLKRYSIGDLNNLLNGWTKRQESALFGQSGIITRRVMPMDI